MAINVLAIVQARMGSTRLPGKVLKEVNGKPLISILFHRLSLCKKIDKIVLATSDSKENDELSNIVSKLGFAVFHGNEDDVLNRYYEAAKLSKPKTVVRITGDCPIIEPKLVDNIIEFYQTNEVDYASNINPPTFPDGLDTEVFSFIALEKANQQATLPYDREHVTPFLRSNLQFKKINYKNTEDLSNERWTVDEPADFEVIKNIINYFSPNLDFTMLDIINLKNIHPEYFSANINIKRNEGANMGKGQKLYKRAKKIIPGGTMLFSKRPEMFLPEQWPSYFSKAKGCNVWDLDGKKYIDMSIMGIGTNTLGYGHPEVDEAVCQVIRQGNMSTLNCPEEVILAEKLVELHPWANMVRFARSGGEANAIAIRIAHAATGKEKVAFCGYHGWHDWFLSANLANDKNLEGHLMPGLDSKGIPAKLIGTNLPFNYNDYESLERLVNQNDIGIIKMEVSRSVEPKKGFLQSVRKLASEKNIVLIFDECTSGFRETFGGLHKKYGVEPDMMMLGKTLGNGYAITCVLGKEEIMKAAEDTFISSTFWTERIGPSAALKTIEVMGREKSWEKITGIGITIGNRWKALAKKYELPIKISGIPALVDFTIPVSNWLKYKTFITQEMLKKGFLAGNSIYVCLEHKEKIVNQYFKELDPIFSIISECENDRNIDEILETSVCHSGFRRLN